MIKSFRNSAPIVVERKRESRNCKIFVDFVHSKATGWQVWCLPKMKEKRK